MQAIYCSKILFAFFLCVLFHTVNTNFILFSLTKQLYVPGKRWSQVTLTHQLNTLTPYVFNVKAEFILSQSTQFNQTNSVFDFFRTSSNFESLSSCYRKSVDYMNNLYDQYQPCEEKCDAQKIDISDSYLRQTDMIQTIGDQNVPSQYFIIDNTFYPCEKGVYLPELNLFQQINFTIEANTTFWSLFDIGCVVMLQILIMLITYIMIMFNKLHHKKSKLLKLKQQEDNKDVLKNFLQSKTNL